MPAPRASFNFFPVPQYFYGKLYFVILFGFKIGERNSKLKYILCSNILKCFYFLPVLTRLFVKCRVGRVAMGIKNYFIYKRLDDIYADDDFFSHFGKRDFRIDTEIKVVLVKAVMDR